jgi:hypothetical protein
MRTTEEWRRRGKNITERGMRRRLELWGKGEGSVYCVSTSKDNA